MTTKHIIQAEDVQLLGVLHDKLESYSGHTKHTQEDYVRVMQVRTQLKNILSRIKEVEES